MLLSEWSYNRGKWECAIEEEKSKEIIKWKEWGCCFRGDVRLLHRREKKSVTTGMGEIHVYKKGVLYTLSKLKYRTRKCRT